MKTSVRAESQTKDATKRRKACSKTAQKETSTNKNAGRKEDVKG
jgi:hypothetical protein